jgi:hypothetical protein
MAKRKRTPPAGDHPEATTDPAHAPRKKRLGPPAGQAHEHRDAPMSRMHDQRRPQR